MMLDKEKQQTQAPIQTIEVESFFKTVSILCKGNSAEQIDCMLVFISVMFVLSYLLYVFIYLWTLFTYLFT
jgi:hypothetical protein